jgi:hypothetical protein
VAGLKFPDVSGSNLLRQKVTLPGDFQGELNLVFIAFQQWHQAWINSWLPCARQLEDSYPGLKYFETPVIHKMSILSKTFINEGMRAGIPNQDSREKTITLYLDKTSFRQSLGIPHEETIWVYLLDCQGNVVWRVDGPFSTEKAESLLTFIHDYFSESIFSSASAAVESKSPRARAPQRL